MRINNSKPLGNEPVPEDQAAESSKLGEIKPEKGVIESVSTKYTMYLDGVVQAAPLAGEAAGTVKTQADLMQYNLQKAVDAARSTKMVKWEGPDLNVTKNEK